MNEGFRIVGDIPKANEAEHAQFKRVIPLLRDAALRHCDWAILLLSVPYRHVAGTQIDNDHDWNGEIDALLLTRNKIVLYELKGYTVELRYAPTNSREWKIKRTNEKTPVHVPSTFIQVSKQRAYLLREFLENFHQRHALGDELHFVVDARVVYKAGSDLSGFFYAIPRTEDPDTFDEKVISQIADENDRNFVRWCYSWVEGGTGKHRLRKLSRDKDERLKKVYANSGIVPRTANWFAPVTESGLLDDFNRTGSDRFELSCEVADEIADELFGQPRSRYRRYTTLRV